MHANLKFWSSLALALTVSVSAAYAAETVARGNEPGWVLRLDESAGSLTFQPMDGSPITVSPLPAAETARVYRMTVDGKDFTVTMTDKVCTDTMSGMPHPATASVVLDGKSFRGCGGDPKSLLVGQWTLTGIGGTPVVAGSEPTLAFEADGNFNGNGSCNRYFGTFTLSGEGLSMGKPGATMMMCEQPKMEQEGRFFEILGQVSRFEIGGDGALILHAADGRSITAVRKG